MIPGLRSIACPVALHPDGFPARIPVFEHPQAGFQLIKGGVTPSERPEAAAARELFEESGLETRAAVSIGHSDSIQENARWHFSLCRVAPPVRPQWQHLCCDDGGHLFKFQWLALTAPPPEPFDPIFQRALDWMRAQL